MSQLRRIIFEEVERDMRNCAGFVGGGVSSNRSHSVTVPKQTQLGSQEKLDNEEEEEQSRF